MIWRPILARLAAHIKRCFSARWERRGGKGVAALGGGGARGVAGGGDERSAAAGPDSAVGLPGATGVAAAGGSAPGRWPATAHVQTRIALCNTLLHMQQEFVMGRGQPCRPSKSRVCEIRTSSELVTNRQAIPRFANSLRYHSC